MGVLSSLLPGVRDLRGPLAAGYIWLLILWLWFADTLPSEETATGVFATLYRLGNLVSSLGIVAALSFVAYIVGALSGSVSSGLLSASKRVLQYRHFLIRAPMEYARFLNRVARNIMGNLTEHHRRAYLNQLEEESLLEEELRWILFYGDPRQPPEQPRGGHARRLLRIGGRKTTARGLVHQRNFLFPRDRDVLRTRLMARHETLYGEFDRYQSEAEFRSAIAVPLGVLIVSMAFLAHAIWLSFLAAVVGLWVQAIRIDERADLALVAGVTGKHIDSPTAEILQDAASRVRSPDIEIPWESNA